MTRPCPDYDDVYQTKVYRNLPTNEGEKMSEFICSKHDTPISDCNCPIVAPQPEAQGTLTADEEKYLATRLAVFFDHDTTLHRCCMEALRYAVRDGVFSDRLRKPATNYYTGMPMPAAPAPSGEPITSFDAPEPEAIYEADLERNRKPDWPAAPPSGRRGAAGTVAAILHKGRNVDVRCYE